MPLKPDWVKRFEDIFENHFDDRERSRLLRFIEEELDKRGEEEYKKGLDLEKRISKK